MEKAAILPETFRANVDQTCQEANLCCSDVVESVGDVIVERTGCRTLRS